MLGFFDTLYWSRQFKRHMDIKRSARMVDIPQLGVPEILVDDEEERSARSATRNLSRQTTSGFPSAMTSGPGATSPTTGALLSADDATRAHHHRTSSGATADLSAFDTSYGQHPLAGPRSPDAMSPGGQHRAGQPSAFSFDLQEVSDAGGSSTRSSRRGSVNAENVREMLDDSVWMDSIRRSATVRKGEWGSGSQGWH